VNILDQFRFLHFGWRDAIEIAIVAYGFYRLLLLIHGTRAIQMIIGIMVIAFLYALAWLFKFTMITYVMEVLFPYGAFAALIIFQPELRAALARLGQSRVTRFFRSIETSSVADEITGAVERLSRSGIGCIIAVERETALGDYVASGTAMQA
jgi:diadenylate cyclase